MWDFVNKGSSAGDGERQEGMSSAGNNNTSGVDGADDFDDLLNEMDEATVNYHNRSSGGSSSFGSGGRRNAGLSRRHHVDRYGSSRK